MRIVQKVVAVLTAVGGLAPSLTAGPATAGAVSVATIPGCERGSPFGTASVNLDDFAVDWGVFPETGGPICRAENVTAPSRDGRSLALTLGGGAAPYPNAHFYRHFASEPGAKTLILSTHFRYTPTSTCNNQGSPSVVQAIEFPVNKWLGGRRWEAAVQWANVASGGSQLRYWDPSRAPADRWVSFTPVVPSCLAGDSWHYLQLVATIVGDAIRYDRIVLDSTVVTPRVTVPSVATPGEPDRLAVAVQLDGNATASSYSVFIDRMQFSRH